MTTKERIVLLAKDKGISNAALLKKAGLPRGLLDGDKLDFSVTDKYLVKILGIYPDVNLEWLVTGEGQMYKTPVVMPKDVVSLDRYTEVVRDNERLRVQLELATSAISKRNVSATTN